MNPNTATEYRDLPLAALTESATNPRRVFEDAALKELADFVSGHKIGVLWRSPFCCR
jgi:ParB family chromosome partitioning protein